MQLKTMIKILYFYDISLKTTKNISYSYVYIFIIKFIIIYICFFKILLQYFKIIFEFAFN